jgi:hypothetical protein
MRAAANTWRGRLQELEQFSRRGRHYLSISVTPTGALEWSNGVRLVPDIVDGEHRLVMRSGPNVLLTFADAGAFLDLVARMN